MRAKKLDKQSDLSSAIGSSAARGLYDALGERPFGGSSARSQGSSGGPRRTRKRHEKEELESGDDGPVGRKFRSFSRENFGRLADEGKAKALEKGKAAAQLGREKVEVGGKGEGESGGTAGKVAEKSSE